MNYSPYDSERTAQRSYSCQCGKPIFFLNSQCLTCGAPLGYEPDLGRVYALEALESPGSWRLATGGPAHAQTYRRCANLDSVAGCNWLVACDETSSHATFCQSCRLDRTIPDLSLTANFEIYRRISIAKRRLISLLIALRLPTESRLDSDRGLTFDFLQNPVSGPRVVTGHADGIITLNIEEAVDSTRERIRDEMGEPYRTILGHLRHEVGHYYWDRLISGTHWLDGFRKVFGDERRDYEEALRQYYQRDGKEWQQNFISAYATSHPWEDWAETWAHYLHMVDTFETALSFGLDPESSIQLNVEPFEADSLSDQEDPGAATFLAFVNSWTRLTAVLNELSRAMGLPDFYPFVLSKGAVAKLHFIQVVSTRSAFPLPQNIER